MDTLVGWLPQVAGSFHFWMAETAGNLELQLVEKHESPTNWNIKEECAGVLPATSNTKRIGSFKKSPHLHFQILSKDGS